MHRAGSIVRAASQLAAGALVGMLLTPAAGRAAETTSPGKALYLKYCSACHGTEGKGDGVVSGFLRPKPTDLTHVSKKGEFPFMRVAQAIDGTTPIHAHGESDMPVWGEVFREESSATLTRQAEVRGKVMLITDFIRSIQQEDKPKQ